MLYDNQVVGCHGLVGQTELSRHTPKPPGTPVLADLEHSALSRHRDAGSMHHGQRRPLTLAEGRHQRFMPTPPPSLDDVIGHDVIGPTTPEGVAMTPRGPPLSSRAIDRGLIGSILV